jgi:hypothetical protein
MGSLQTRPFGFWKHSQPALTKKQRAEQQACKASPAYWLNTYGQVYDATAREWLAFRLWPAQEQVLVDLEQHRLTCVVKARQLGLSWLVVGWALWLMLYRPAATVLFFSKRDAEAVHLLNFRLRGMLGRLPGWMAPPVTVDNAHDLRLANGSVGLAFPTTGGRSYTASLAIVDEADFAEDLDGLLNAVKPTIDAGGRLALVSTSNKAAPESAFKRIHRAAERGENGYRAVFLPWSARPERTAEWYAAQRADVLARTGALDDLYQEYPATVLEAFAPRALDRRFSAEWLSRCDDTGRPMADTGLQVADTGSQMADSRFQMADLAASDGIASGPSAIFNLPSAIPAPALPGLVVFAPPAPGAAYVIGADPAEGNPQSDESAATVLDVNTGAQVAVLGGRVEPAVFGSQLAALAEYYNGAAVLVERNNHGHAVQLWLREFASARLLNGLDGKPGWLSSGRGKAVALDAAADAFRDGLARIRDRETLAQLASIEGTSLRAPAGPGEHRAGRSSASHDDRAIALCLALAALRLCAVVGAAGVTVPARDAIVEADREYW